VWGYPGDVRAGGHQMTQRLPKLYCRVLRHFVRTFLIAFAALRPAEASSPSSGGGESAFVVDGNSGNVLYSAKSDELRHPASLTKIMTLYLLFERMEAGKFKLNSQLPVSQHASVQAPSKLGLRPGQTISVEDAIRAMVTKSANDVAVVVAEAIGGSEGEFANMMTKKAHALGMSRTVYRNASGLPNDGQLTTARDQALLGRAIQERFPRQYHYFSTPSFTYHGETMSNHNHLLGQVEGIDGIKTGYTQASGFNLVTSVHRNKRYIVAVVLGGESAGARDARMRALIEATSPPRVRSIPPGRSPRWRSPRTKSRPRKQRQRIGQPRQRRTIRSPHSRPKRLGLHPNSYPCLLRGMYRQKRRWRQSHYQRSLHRRWPRRTGCPAPQSPPMRSRSKRPSCRFG
jgi:D-alanyl-D-alanine carboxypeptidase